MPARVPILRRLASPAATDCDLLRAFAATADPAALAELAERYAGLARRAANDVFPPAADDVAQAALVLLGRRAAVVADRESAAGWVFETARRLALKARVSAARRARHEAQASPARPPADPLDALTLREVRAAVAEEVARLPDALRTPLVLCYWEGATRADAAARAGCSESTLKRRLDAGRDRVAARLAGRGFAGPAVLAALVALQASGRATAALAVAAAVGDGSLTAGAAALVRASGRWALAGRLAALATVVLAGGGLALRVAAGDPPAAPAAERPNVGPPAGAAVDAHGDPLPPGAVARLGTTRFRAGMWPKHLAPSPDGKHLLTVGFNHGGAEYLTAWNLATGRPDRQLTAPKVEVVATDWLPGGRGFAVLKVSMADYAVWEFTDPAALPPAVVRPDEINRLGPGTFTAAAVSPDGKLVAGGQRAGGEGNEGTLQVWELTPNGRVRDMKVRLTADTVGGIVALRFTPDSRRLVAVARRREPDRPDPTPDRHGPVPLVPGKAADVATVTVLATDTGESVAAFETPAGPAGAYALSRDGTTLYAGGAAGRVAAFDLAGAPGRVFDVAPAGKPAPAVTHLAVAADGKSILVALGGDGLAAFDTGTGKELWRTTDPEMRTVYGLAGLPDGRFAVGAVDGAVLLLDAATGRVTNEQPGPRGWLGAVAFADGGKAVLTCERSGAVRRWDVAIGRELSRTTPADLPMLRGIGFSPDNKSVLGVGFVDKEFIAGFADATTGKLTARLATADGSALSGLSIYGGRPLGWMPDGSVVVATGGDAAARYGPDGREMKRYAADPDGATSGGQVTAVAVSPDGREVVLAGTGPRDGFARGPSWVAVYDAATGAARRRWESATQFKNAAYTPDGSAVVLCGYVHQPPRPVEQPPAALDLGTAVAVFDPATGRGASPFAAPDPAASFRAAAALAVSPTGAQFAVAESDHTLTVYETASGVIRRRLAGHRNHVYQLAFTPDGKRLVSVSGDGTGLVWDVAPPSPTGAVNRSIESRRAAWAALAGDDGAAAYRAMGELIADPAGVAFLKDELRPAAADAGGRWDRLTGSRLRERRAVEVLEAAGTAEARGVLAGVAGTDTPLGREAAAATARLDRR